MYVPPRILSLHFIAFQNIINEKKKKKEKTKKASAKEHIYYGPAPEIHRHFPQEGDPENM